MTRMTLPIAETFYSIQGEGPSAGVPAVFLRTSHCNLRCPGWGPAGAEQGCDTLAVWQQTSGVRVAGCQSWRQLRTVRTGARRETRSMRCCHFEPR